MQFVWRPLTCQWTCPGKFSRSISGPLMRRLSAGYSLISSEWILVVLVLVVLYSTTSIILANESTRFQEADHKQLFD